MLWNDCPEPMMRTFSPRSGARALPMARCFSGSNPATSESCTVGTSASGNDSFRGMKTP